MTMSINDKSQSAISVPAQPTQQGQPLQAVLDASASLRPKLPAIPDWIPGGNTPMLMARRPAEQRVLFFTIQAEHFDDKHGGAVVAPGLSNLGGGDWLCYRNVDFDQGANRFLANLSAAQVDPASAIEVRLDSPTAPAIAVLKVQKTPDWSAFLTQSAPIEPATGVHDVYLTFSGPSRVADLDWIKFVRLPREASSQIAGNSYDDAHGVNDHDGVIANIDRGDFLKYSQLDFGEGLETFEACIGVGDRYSNGQPANTHGQMEIRIDAVDGPVVGMLITQSTGAFTTHVPQSTPIGKTSGIHDVYLTFRTNAVCDLEWITFKK
jgi:arabinoxylan arabinofuranohydrolase